MFGRIFYDDEPPEFEKRDPMREQAEEECADKEGKALERCVKRSIRAQIRARRAIGKERKYRGKPLGDDNSNGNENGKGKEVASKTRQVLSQAQAMAKAARACRLKRDEKSMWKCMERQGIDVEEAAKVFRRMLKVIEDKKNKDKSS